MIHNLGQSLKAIVADLKPDPEAGASGGSPAQMPRRPEGGPEASADAPGAASNALMEAVCSQADAAGRTARVWGPVVAHIGQRRISEDWANPISEAGAALMDSYLREGGEVVTCTGCCCEAVTAYFAPRKDDTELSVPGDALCEACSYALRFKRFVCETEAPDDMSEEYARHLEQQREDAR
eukprot:1861535-Alexandrium_andersonii.AAC.1